MSRLGRKLHATDYTLYARHAAGNHRATRVSTDAGGPVTGSTVVIRFNVMIDGEARAAEVEVGKGNFKPNENPVRARLKP